MTLPQTGRAWITSRIRSVPPRAHYLDRLGIQPGMIRLDVGCGMADVTFELSRQVGPTGRVVDVDLDQSRTDGFAHVEKPGRLTARLDRQRAHPHPQWPTLVVSTMTPRIAAPPNRRPAAMHTVATRRMESPDLSRAHSPVSRIPNRVCRQDDQSRCHKPDNRANICAVAASGVNITNTMIDRDGNYPRHRCSWPRTARIATVSDSLSFATAHEPRVHTMIAKEDPPLIGAAAPTAPPNEPFDTFIADRIDPCLLNAYLFTSNDSSPDTLANYHVVPYQLATIYRDPLPFGIGFFPYSTDHLPNHSYSTPHNLSRK